MEAGGARQLKVCVIGAGAMGSLFGGYLSAAGHEVWLVDTATGHADAIARQGLRIVEPNGEERVVRPRAVTDPRSVGPCDLVLVFVKSYHTRQAAASLAPLLAPSTVVLTLQNGLGNVDALAEEVPRSHLMAGTTGQGANVLGAGRIHHAGSGETLIGELDGAPTDRLRCLVEAFTDAGLHASASNNVQGVIWAKLLVNIAINPLTAILRVRNGRLLEMPEAVEIMKEAVDEGLAVASRAGVRVPLEDPWAHVRDVARRTGDNRSSMLQDVEMGRQTEIDVINGAVVREGSRLGVATPVNLALMHLVKCLEQIPLISCLRA
ncbi:MAG: 2-dehydropantoate 2-reductase [bacterium]|nr:2-dehydropantoate 2-reductase [bacterium]